MVILEIFKSQEDKIINSSFLLQLKEDQKREFVGGDIQWASMAIFL